jgi:hypothetical protein
MHPDTIEEPHLYRDLGRKLLIENIDARKDLGATQAELAPTFAELPEVGFCFDIARLVDRPEHVGRERAAGGVRRAAEASPRELPLPRSASRSPHREHEDLFSPLLQRCLDVPWILEAPPRPR